MENKVLFIFFIDLQFLITLLFRAYYFLEHGTKYFLRNVVTSYRTMSSFNPNKWNFCDNRGFCALRTTTISHELQTVASQCVKFGNLPSPQFYEINAFGTISHYVLF